MSISIEAHDRICQDLHQQIRNLIVENERLRAAAQQALEALETCDAAHISDGGRQWYDDKAVEEAITALKAALAEPVQEPVALDWLHKWANQDDGAPETQWHEGYEAARRVVQIHLTTPPQRPAETVQEPVAYAVGRTLHWHEGKGVNDAQLYLAAPPQRKPLPVDQIYEMYSEPSSDAEMVEFARAIERAHGIGGEG